MDHRGVEIGKAIGFKNNREGYESIVAKIEEVCKEKGKKREAVMVGMEPTGHYWKGLANYMKEAGLRVVCVNPYHTKKAKELDDNSPTKNDKKDAVTIARLVKDGRYYEPYLPKDRYGELRSLSNARGSILKRQSAIKNTTTALLDEYFPELRRVFKKPLEGKASRQILKSCPLPEDILAKGEGGVQEEVRKAVKRTVGQKKVRELIEVAKGSIGVRNGARATRIRIRGLMEELELLEKQLGEIEGAMKEELEESGYGEQLLGIKGIGVVSAATFLGEVGDPLRFENARQIMRYAGYNLVEKSSGKSKSGTSISKRGRKQLRRIQFLMAVTMVGQNEEMKKLYQYMRNRTTNPLARKAALIVISKKIITVIYSLIKKNERYDPKLVLGRVRSEMMAA